MKNVNSKLICAAVSVMLLCSSCGRQDASGQIPAKDLTADNPGSNNSNNANTGQNNNTDPGSNGSGNNDAALDADAAASGAITIDTETIEDSDTAEDGTVIYTMSYVKPSVTIEGNEAAAQKINADLLSRIEAFTADTTLRNEAKEYYDISLTETDYYFNEYSESLDFEAMRSDTNVISFITTIYSYAGGAHGDYGRFGINYSAKSGELIDFSELADDAEQFRSDTLEYNRNLASSDEYKERMFPDDFLDSGEFENVLYADEKWYLSNEGLVFISNPYELGPYSSGVIEFVIPYDELYGMGLREEYKIE